MDNTRRSAPPLFSSPTRKYRNISPDRYQMDHCIAPLSKSIKRKDTPTPAANSPRESTLLSLREESPWNGSSSPDLHESLASGGRPPSQIELLDYSQATPVPDVYHSGASPPAQTTPWWAIILKSKWAMVACLVIGVASAISHHLLYRHLHDNEAEKQGWWLRLGQFLAFVAKANFVIAVFIAHQQVAWRAVGQQGYSVHAIDSLFGAAHNVIELFNKEAWRKSWLVMFLAMYIWVSPFVVIFPSATLSVVVKTRQGGNTCSSVRTLNLSNEAKEVWNEPKRAENETLTGIRLSWYNRTTEATDGPDSFEYWIDSNVHLKAIASRVFTGGQALQRECVAADICGQGWDCSTIVHFIGPGYKCQKLAKGVNSTVQKFGDQEAPFNLSKLFPVGESPYFTISGIGDYTKQQIEGEFPELLGALRTEPIIWLGYVTVDDVTAKHAQNSSEDGWDNTYTPIISACEHWEMNYTVNLTYTGGFQSYNVTKREFLRKVINTTYVDGWVDDATYDKTVAEPQVNYVFPRDWESYQRIAGYHALGKELRYLLNGKVILRNQNYLTYTDMVTSKLIGRHEYLPVSNFEEKIRRLYEDLLISLLSDPQFLVVAWASDPSKMSGTKVGGPETAYACKRWRTVNCFFYHWKVLVSVYTVSFLVAAVGVGYGIMAMWQDGVRELREMTFSSIVEATRRVDLDRRGYRGKRVRAWLVEESHRGRLYEFRTEDYNERNSNMTKDKNGSNALAREVSDS